MTKRIDPNAFIANSAIKNGLQYQHNYIVDIAVPLWLRNSDCTDEYLSWNAVEVTVPGVALTVETLAIGGRPRHKVAERSDVDLIITFLDDNKMTVRRQFEKWMQYAYNPYSKIRKYPSSFSAQQLIISTTDSGGIVKCNDKFIEVFPSEISQMDLNASLYETVKTQVTFKYRIHLVELPTEKKTFV